jgi:hypothetical protein
METNIWLKKADITFCGTFLILNLKHLKFLETLISSSSLFGHIICSFKDTNPPDRLSLDPWEIVIF